MASQALSSATILARLSCSCAFRFSNTAFATLDPTEISSWKPSDAGLDSPDHLLTGSPEQGEKPLIKPKLSSLVPIKSSTRQVVLPCPAEARGPTVAERQSNFPSV